MDENRFWGMSALVIGVALIVGLGVTIGVSASNRGDDDVATEQVAPDVDEGLLVLAIAVELSDAQTTTGGSTTAGTTTSGTATATTTATTGTTTTAGLTAADISRLQEEQRQRAEARSAYLAQLRQSAQAGAAAARAEAQARADAADQQAAQAARDAQAQLQAELETLRQQEAADAQQEQLRQAAQQAYDRLASELESARAAAESAGSDTTGTAPDQSVPADQTTAELEQLATQIDGLLEQASAAAAAGDYAGAQSALDEVTTLLQNAAAG